MGEGRPGQAGQAQAWTEPGASEDLGWTCSAQRLGGLVAAAELKAMDKALMDARRALTNSTNNWTKLNTEMQALQTICAALVLGIAAIVLRIAALW